MDLEKDFTLTVVLIPLRVEVRGLWVLVRR